MKYLTNRGTGRIVPVWDMHHYIMAVALLDLEARVHEDGPPDISGAWSQVKSTDQYGRHRLLAHGVRHYYPDTITLFLAGARNRYSFYVSSLSISMRDYDGFLGGWEDGLAEVGPLNGPTYGLIDFSYSAMRRGRTVLENGTAPYAERAERDAALLATIIRAGRDNHAKALRILGRLDELRQPWWKAY